MDAASGIYEHHDDFTLSETNGVTGSTDWLLEAKVWEENEEDREVIKKVEFHVHP